MLAIILAVILGYLLGSIPFGLLVGKAWTGIDVRRHGSGNIGATNVLRTAGVGPAVIVLLLDATKGIAAATLGITIGDHPIGVISGVASVVGHNWPLFLGFKGGKGVATGLGVLVTIAPLSVPVLGGIFLLTVTASRYVSLGSILSAAAVPLVLLLLRAPTPVTYGGTLLGALALYRHLPNMRRLISGTENKLGSKPNG